jgi:RNA polymerase sigma factor (sigma-70 family)
MAEPPGSKSEWIGSALSRHEGRLLRYATRLLGDADRAQDVVQDTFLQLCREDPVRLDGYLVPWLFTVCRNRARDLRRQDGRLRSLDEDGPFDAVAPDPSPVHVLESAQALDAVRAVLATLPASQREAVRLKFQADLTYKEIAAVTGLTVTHVGVLIHMALKAVRARVRGAQTVPAARRMS